MLKRITALLFLAVASAVPPAAEEAVRVDRNTGPSVETTAEECDGPCMLYTSSLELNADWVHFNDADIGDSYVAGPNWEFGLTLQNGDGLSVIGNFVTEPVFDPEPGVNQVYTQVGTYVDILQVQYEVEDFTVWGGKIHPAFGVAWDVTPGLHGTDIAENYELDERIGAGAGYDFTFAGMANVAEIDTFTADRTIFSESLFTNRGRNSLSDGGAGNTNGISAVSFALTGCAGAAPDACYEDGEFGYTIGARYQKAGEDDFGDEYGFVAGMSKTFTLDDETALEFFGEAAYFSHFEGTEVDAAFITGSGALTYQSLTYSLTYSAQDNISSDEPDDVESIFDATVLYALDESLNLVGEQWSIGADYTLDRADGETIQTIGLRFSSDLEGKTPLKSSEGQ